MHDHDHGRIIEWGGNGIRHCSITPGLSVKKGYRERLKAVAVRKIKCDNRTADVPQRPSSTLAQGVHPGDLLHVMQRAKRSHDEVQVIWILLIG